MITKKYKLLALLGESCTGKDTIKKKILGSDSYRFKGIVSYTTRPKRDNEVDGVDYHFIDNKKFEELLLNNELIAVTSFNDWFYGTRISSLKLVTAK